MGGFSPNKMENRKGIPIPQTKPRPKPYTQDTQTINPQKSLSKCTFTRNIYFPGLQ